MLSTYFHCFWFHFSSIQWILLFIYSIFFSLCKWNVCNTYIYLSKQTRNFITNIWRIIKQKKSGIEGIDFFFVDSILNYPQFVFDFFFLLFLTFSIFLCSFQFHWGFWVSKIFWWIFKINTNLKCKYRVSCFIWRISTMNKKKKNLIVCHWK